MTRSASALPSPPNRLVPWAHRFLADILRPGDSAVDLTAGNGWDTLFLFGCVGSSGTVLAFDIQEEALGTTAERVRSAGARVGRPDPGEEPTEPGVFLILDDHAHLERYCRSIRGAVANLGYRPGGARQTATSTPRTRLALSAAMARLEVGGRMVVVTYVGHPGGREEAEMVEELFGGMDAGRWSTVGLSVPNQPLGPRLFMAERRK